MDRQVGQARTREHDRGRLVVPHSLYCQRLGQSDCHLSELYYERNKNDHPFINQYRLESIGAALADMLSKLGAVPRLGLQSP